jgi:uncharacterized protein involved in exopolysaccharide biosynthesis
LASVVAGVREFLATPMFQGVAQIRAERDRPDALLPGERHFSPEKDHELVHLKFALEYSEEILGRAIARLDLRAKWGKPLATGGNRQNDEALTLLRHRLKLRRDGAGLRESGCFLLSAASDSPGEAAQIANAIVEAYRDYRQEQQQKREPAGGVAGERPPTPQVEIQQRAQPPTKPFVPNRTFAALLVGCGLAVFGAGASLVHRSLRPVSAN